MMDEKKNNVFFSNLKKLREKKGMTRTAFAKMLGVHRQNYSKWEDGILGIRLETAHLLCDKMTDYFGMSYKLADLLEKDFLN
jgi:DNA-binding XRE family transcriptional regulator